MSDTTDLMGLGMPAALAQKIAEMVANAGAGAELPGFTTAGGTNIPAGTASAQIQAVGNLADPSA